MPILQFTRIQDLRLQTDKDFGTLFDKN